jgi:N-acetylglucosaminyldiphosphoundecaprenol N-acetyl-beta-D-mannosaminyltransferase
MKKISHLKLSEKNRALGVPFNLISFENAMSEIIDIAVHKNFKSDLMAYIFTPNVQHLYLYDTNYEFRQAYESAELSLIDSMPMLWVARRVVKKTVEKISGSDLFVKLLPILLEKGMRVTLFGGAQGAAEKAHTIICNGQIQHDMVQILSPEFGFESDSKKNQNIIDTINGFKPHVIFVALGSPKGELWIYRNQSQLKAGLAIGVGAAFDFAAGVQKRAPAWMQKIGLEWLFRLFTNPNRLFKRYLITNCYYFKKLLFSFLNLSK